MLPWKIIFIFIFILSLVYVIFPLDFIPDVIPIVGWIDDLFVFLGGLVFLVKSFRG